MKIVIINSGSSSIKYQLITMPSQEVVCSGMIDRIGLESSTLTYVTTATQLEEHLPIRDHKEGLQKIASLLLNENIG
jgi:acetate kinase